MRTGRSEFLDCADQRRSLVELVDSSNRSFVGAYCWWEFIVCEFELLVGDT